MTNRNTFANYMLEINKEGATPETRALAIVLVVLLDIRDQNEVIIERLIEIKNK